MLEVVHIHTNLNFVDDTDRFDESYFNNAVILIGAPSSYRGPYGDKALCLSTSRRDLDKTIDICLDVDLVVLYGLGVRKSYIAARLPAQLPIAWRFFGYELYVREKEDYLSKKALALHRRNDTLRYRGVGNLPSELGRAARGETSLYRVLADPAKRVLPDAISNSLSLLKSRLIYGASPDRLFEEAIKRIDLFLGLSDCEYEHLMQRWDYLPSFVQLPMRLNVRERDPANIKDSTVIIGNSRSAYNNHLQIMKLIDELDPREELSFVIPFSYGSEGAYTKAVRNRAARSHSDFRFIEQFLPKEEYYDLITRAKSAVFNSYRQMAMGNILPMLTSGVKIYLNSRNVIHHWLLDHGFNVYTVKDFAADLESGNLGLSRAQRLENAAAWRRLQAKYNRNRFAAEILDIVAQRR
jgi:hypothetical protein